MQDSLLMLIAGVLLAWFGGEFFVRGGVGLARWMRWPTAVIGVTVAAFGTSSPELLVATHAALDGVPEISLGDVLGSNVVNASLILGLVLAAGGMKVEDKSVSRDWLVALLAPGVVYALLMDGWFSRFDASVMLLLFVGWLVQVIRRARNHAGALAAGGSAPKPRMPMKTALTILLGLALLISSAQLVVQGGKGVASALGWSPFIVGAVVVAAATSTPELATTLVARIKGHHDVGLGNILGSCVFNILFIASIAAFIHPYAVKMPELLPSLAFGVLTLLLVLPGSDGTLPRWRGWVLLVVYAIFVHVSLQQTPHPHG